jgi:hypothetical protein
MKQEVRILLGLLIFYLVYVMLVDFTGLSRIPLLILIAIFGIYLYIPDISNDNNILNKYQKYLVMLLVLFAIGVYIATNLLLTPLIIVGVALVLMFLTTNNKIYDSLTTGIFLSAPLILLNPFYFLFGFLGYLTFWISSRI